MKNGEIASFGEEYKGQYDREFYTTDDRGIIDWIFFILDKYNDEIIDEEEDDELEKDDYSGL